MNNQRDGISTAIVEAWMRSDHLADAVIAHLWREAMKPDVTEALQRKLANGNEHIYGLFEGDAVELVETILTALLGPNPNEEAQP